MKNFPMFLRMDGRRVVICGSGAEAARKARLILKTEAEIVILGRDLDPELAGLVSSGRAMQHEELRACTFEGAVLAFVATGCEEADAALKAEARKAGAIVNVIDRPEMCDAFTPSIVDRDPVVVAIGTEGTAPVLGRAIRSDIEQMLSPRMGGFAALAGRLRDAVAERVPHRGRRAFWQWAFWGAPFQAHEAGRESAAADMLKAALETGALPEAQGHISLVGAGPGARDLLTLRALRRLQEADVIFYDRLVDPEVLDLARRDANRIYVGKEVGQHAWPQQKIDRVIVAEALKGRRVVRLKSGDPSIFGRAAEEIAAARAAGIEVEIVPGITAASAAAASIMVPLTERGETDSFAVTTGVCRPGDANPDRSLLARPGTSLAVYMGVEKAVEIQADLLASGAPADCPVDIVSNASTARERHAAATLGTLAETIRREGLPSPAILFLRHPKSLAAGQVQEIRAA